MQLLKSVMESLKILIKIRKKLRLITTISSDIRCRNFVNIQQKCELPDILRLQKE